MRVEYGPPASGSAAGGGGGATAEEVSHVLAVLRQNEIDGSVLVLLEEEDLRDLGIPKAVARTLSAAVDLEFNPSDTFIADHYVHVHHPALNGL